MQGRKDLLVLMALEVLISWQEDVVEQGRWLYQHVPWWLQYNVRQVGEVYTGGLPFPVPFDPHSSLRFRSVLPSLVNPLCKCPHGHTQRVFD